MTPVEEQFQIKCDELEEVARELRRSNEDLQEFAYVASHDLQEPLRAISGFARLLVRRHSSELNSEAKEFLDLIVDGAARLERMIEDLLALSRVTTQGREPAQVSAESVFTGSLRSLSAVMEEGGAEVTHDALPEVMADDGQLRRVFQNLISNAIKFHREGTPPKIHVSAERDGEMWRFAVEDNGIGIDEAYHDKVFKLFQRLEARTEVSGTGLGLAIVKKIVERHGGRAWFNSTEGAGSTFYFTLPAVKSLENVA
jgi:light-regulated signal transduction histidine kinase (bacteriophytochrome)